ncbi:MAG: serine/threonine protein kinase, partial [Planctomycetales bacterium]|nr:serine/threonine protein kinase [Planctomycetales bacterium]
MSHFDDEFDEIIDRFERARRTSPAVDVADFFPPPNESHFCAIATELLRVDLQYGWQNGNPTSLHEYQRRFPSVLNNRQHLGQLAFEEFRTRRLAGHAIDAREYSRQYSIDTHNWPDVNNSTVANKSKDQSTVVSGETPATSHGVPTLKAGDTFDRFRLRKELGKGAFARVFLATQPELAERDVVLKLTAAEGTDVEPRLLAKLQHTNIVPVYSVHKDRGIFGLCMPDFGPCTLHDVLSECSLQARNRELRSGRLIADAIQQRQRSSTDKNELNNDNTGTFSSLRKSNYVDACVRLMLDVARGLEHAHAQNVVHCDIKPANILIADHGVAMLLDFNLSAEVTVDQAKRSLVGGTLPYLAPEHLSAINDGSTIPESADIYSYGAVFYELLTGQTPHQIIGPKLSPNIEKMISDRRTAPTSVKALAPEVPVSISNVIDRLLAPSPDDRYQSMGDVCDDLVNHLHDRPLQHVANPMPERLSKWKRRNPRLATGLFAMIVCLIATMFIVRAHRDHALQQSSDLFDAQSELADIRVLANIPFFDETLLQQAATQSDAAIKPFVDESEDGERLEIAPTTTLNRDAVFQCVAEHLYLSAHARRRLAERSQQANELNRRADRAEQLMATIPQQSRSAEDDLLPVYQLIADKEWESAIAQLQRLVDRYPKDGSLKALLGNSFAGDNRLREAEEQYS